MIEIIETGSSESDTVAWRIRGKITEDDMELALGTLRKTIEREGYANVYQEIDAIGGVEWDALEAKMAFLREFGTGCFRRIAVVTDKRWMHLAIRWEDRLFKGFEMRAFSTQERARARNFLAYGGGADGDIDGDRGSDADTAPTPP